MAFIFSICLRFLCLPVQGFGDSFRAVFLVLFASTVAACSTPAYKHIDRQAEHLGFERSTQGTSKFRHVVYAPSRSASSDTVHVYIEGDGVAWRWRYFIKADPTPKRGLMLSLMGRDTGNTLYIGRPCYFGLVLDEQCNSDLWTFSRFSEKVVNSMVEVIYNRTEDFSNVVLIGHSGGGALALLIAERLHKTTAVVTVAGNIDTDAWVGHHKYTPLYGSLNPVKRSPLKASIRQLHLVGGKDKVIPASLVKEWIENQPGAELWEIPGNTHLCCWADQWAQVLNWISYVDKGVRLEAKMQ